MSHAFNKVYEKAQNGNIAAKHKLAWMYFKGRGTQQNTTKAMHIFEALAKKKHSPSIFKLGWVHESNGNLEKAIYYYKKGSTLSHAKCNYKLATIYFSLLTEHIANHKSTNEQNSDLNTSKSYTNELNTTYSTENDNSPACNINLSEYTAENNNTFNNNETHKKVDNSTLAKSISIKRKKKKISSVPTSVTTATSASKTTNIHAATTSKCTATSAGISSTTATLNTDAIASAPAISSKSVSSSSTNSSVICSTTGKSENCEDTKALVPKKSSTNNKNANNTSNITIGKAIKFLKKAAKQNLAEAQYKLGLLYLEGCYRSLPKNESKGASWIQKASDQLHPEAMCQLARLHIEGRGVPVDNSAAISLFTRCLEEDCNFMLVKYQLALLYYYGTNGISVMYPIAATYFEQVAATGLSEAQYHLATIYREGRGKERNYKAALLNYRLSAQQGNDKSLCALGWIYEKGLCEELKCTKRAVRYYQEASELGNVFATKCLMRLCVDGQG